MLDFLTNLWSGLLPLWTVSWWWVGLIGLVVGTVWATLGDSVEPGWTGFLCLLAGVFWGFSLMVILLGGTPILIGFAAWRFAKWVKNRPRSMTVESDNLHNKEDLR